MNNLGCTIQVLGEGGKGEPQTKTPGLLVRGFSFLHVRKRGPYRTSTPFRFVRSRAPHKPRKGLRFLPKAPLALSPGGRRSLRSLVLPVGIEPTLRAPQARVLSIELREHIEKAKWDTRSDKSIERTVAGKGSFFQLCNDFGQKSTPCYRPTISRRWCDKGSRCSSSGMYLMR